MRLRSDPCEQAGTPARICIRLSKAPILLSNVHLTIHHYHSGVPKCSMSAPKHGFRSICFKATRNEFESSVHIQKSRAKAWAALPEHLRRLNCLYGGRHKSALEAAHASDK
jgi:hypothetical protein